LAGQISAPQLSDWAAFVFLSGLFRPRGATEEEQCNEGEGPTWDILQRLMTPEVFDGINFDVAKRYIAALQSQTDLDGPSHDTRSGSS
jgi:hypothetical protein